LIVLSWRRHALGPAVSPDRIPVPCPL